jgi:hypothetical protein
MRPSNFVGRIANSTGSSACGRSGSPPGGRDLRKQPRRGAGSEGGERDDTHCLPDGRGPVREGLVRSLNRPGANVTGVSDFANQLAGKRLSLLRDAVPKAGVYAVLVRPSNPNAESDTKDATAAARVLGLDLRALAADNEREIDIAFAAMA